MNPSDALVAAETLAAEIPGADATRLAALRTELLGRKAGRLTQVLRSLADLPDAERRQLGARANALRVRVEAALAEQERALKGGMNGAGPADPSMPGRTVWRGARHPVSIVADEVCEIFRDLGFSRITGPEAESEEYNFWKLNIPLDHPAADMQDSFYVAPGVVLRTHTSPVQARTMERYPPPIRVVSTGQVYRRDAFDPSHAPLFDQIEGLAVDEGLSFVDFKSAILYFVHHFFRRDAVVRFTPSYFPFVEPGAQVEVRCVRCEGAGCATCKRTGFLEIMGAGMVHPTVFERSGIDPERYTGWAFGMGIQRIAMLRYGIPDIRLFYRGDVRFLEQFVD